MIYNGPERFHVIDTVLKNNNLLQLNYGVEIGVRNGDATDYLLRNNKKLRMLCVDPYEEYLDVGDYRYTKEEQDTLYKNAKKRLINWGDRCRLIRNTSVSTSVSIEKGMADFIYIDAVHDNEHVKQDIWAWYPKVRAGGVLFFHDISMKPVREEVDAWVKEFGKTLICSDANSDVGMVQI